MPKGPFSTSVVSLSSLSAFAFWSVGSSSNDSSDRRRNAWEPNNNVDCRAASVDGGGGLTGREVAVLELVAEGRTSVSIGAELGIEPSTVDSFVRSAMRKLGAGTWMAAAVQWQAASEARTSD